MSHQPAATLRDGHPHVQFEPSPGRRAGSKREAQMTERPHPSPTTFSGMPEVCQGCIAAHNPGISSAFPGQRPQKRILPEAMHLPALLCNTHCALCIMHYKSPPTTPNNISNISHIRNTRNIRNTLKHFSALSIAASGIICNFA